MIIGPKTLRTVTRVLTFPWGLSTSHGRPTLTRDGWWEWRSNFYHDGRCVVCRPATCGLSGVPSDGEQVGVRSWVGGPGTEPEGSGRRGSGVVRGEEVYTRPGVKRLVSVYKVGVRNN